MSDVESQKTTKPAKKSPFRVNKKVHSKPDPSKEEPKQEKTKKKVTKRGQNQEAKSKKKILKKPKSESSDSEDSASDEEEQKKPVKKSTTPQKSALKSKKLKITPQRDAVTFGSSKKHEPLPYSPQKSSNKASLNAASPKRFVDSKIYVGTCGLQPQIIDAVRQVAKDLGRNASYVDQGNYHELMTHLLVDSDRILRTHKELAALMNGAWILRVDWFLSALNQGKLNAQDEYEADQFPKRAERAARKLFAGHKYFFYGQFDEKFSVNILMDFVYRQGGKITRFPESGCIVVANFIYSDMKDFMKAQDIDGAPYEDLSGESDFEVEEENEAYSENEEEEKKEAPKKKKKSAHSKKRSALRKMKKAEDGKLIDLSQAEHLVTPAWILESLLYYKQQPFEGYKPIQVDPETEDEFPGTGKEPQVRKKKGKKASSDEEDSEA